jgi:hypothetical protein
LRLNNSSLVHQRAELVSKMVKNHTSIIWLGLSILHLSILLLIVYLPVLRDSSFTAFGITAVIVPYLLHSAGWPVLINDGLSGWTLPSPNVLGWSLSILFWLVFYYFLAKFIAYLLTRRNKGF